MLAAAIHQAAGASLYIANVIDIITIPVSKHYYPYSDMRKPLQREYVNFHYFVKYYGKMKKIWARKRWWEDQKKWGSVLSLDKEGCREALSTWEGARLQRLWRGHADNPPWRGLSQCAGVTPLNLRNENSAWWANPHCLLGKQEEGKKVWNALELTANQEQTQDWMADSNWAEL